MIKGVNKRIVEINSTDSIYFEKAVFYLRPNVRELPCAVSENEIRKYIGRLGLEEPSRRKPPVSRIIMSVFGLAVISGIVLVFLI